MSDPNQPGRINPDVDPIIDPSTAIKSGDVTVRRTVELADFEPPEDEDSADIARLEADGVPIYDQAA